jgi:hypothetical protein
MIVVVVVDVAVDDVVDDLVTVYMAILLFLLLDYHAYFLDHHTCIYRPNILLLLLMVVAPSDEVEVDVDVALAQYTDLDPTVEDPYPWNQSLIQVGYYSHQE